MNGQQHRLPLKYLSCIVAAGILMASASGCRARLDWIMFRGEQGKGATANAAFPPLGIKWKLKLQSEGPAAYAFNNPIVKDGTIFFGSTDGNFYSLDIESGYMNWVFKTGASINSIPYADANNVYFGSNDGKVYSLSQKTGEELWQFDTRRTVQSTIMRYKNNIIFASDGGAMFFLTTKGQEEYSLPNYAWYYNAFQAYQDILYFAPGPESNPHSFGAFDLNLRNYIWILDTGMMDTHWFSFPALDGDSLYFSTCADRYDFWEFSYYSYNRFTGEINWEQREVSRIDPMIDPQDMLDRNFRLLDYLAPCVWENLVIYTSGDNIVRALDKRTGSIVWKREFDVPTSSSPIIAGDRIYFGTHGDASDHSGPAGYGKKPRLVCLSARNGSLMWEIETDGNLMSAPIVSGKWIVFGTDENQFYVLEELTG